MNALENALLPPLWILIHVFFFISVAPLCKAISEFRSFCWLWMHLGGSMCVCVSAQAGVALCVRWRMKRPEAWLVVYIHQLLNDVHTTLYIMPYAQCTQLVMLCIQHAPAARERQCIWLSIPSISTWNRNLHHIDCSLDWLKYDLDWAVQLDMECWLHIQWF